MGQNGGGGWVFLSRLTKANAMDLVQTALLAPGSEMEAVPGWNHNRFTAAPCDLRAPKEHPDKAHTCAQACWTLTPVLQANA